jgi:hypothetical protein
MEWLVHCIVLVIGFPSKQTEWLHRPYYDVDNVLGSIPNQLVKEIRHSSSYEVRSLNVVVWWIAKFKRLDFPQNLPNDFSHHIMMCAKFRGRSKFNWSKKLDISCSLKVRSINGVVGALCSSSGWISLKTHRMTPPNILWCCQSFALDPKSIGQRNWTVQVR